MMMMMIRSINKQVLAVFVARRAASTAAASSGELVRILDDDEKKIRRVVMCDERRRNALGLDMIRSLQAAVAGLDAARHRVLVIASSSEVVFSAGHNLKELTTSAGREQQRAVFDEFARLCLGLRALPVPAVAEVAGLAAAAGCQLAASCDLVVASERAAFSTPGVRFGVFCSTPGVPLVRSLSTKVAARMLFTGAPISARDALAHGLVSELVERPDELAARTDALAAQIVANSASVVALGKRALYEQLEAPGLAAAYSSAGAAMLDNLRLADTQSGLKAFAEKRRPVWTHSAAKVDDDC